MRACKIHQTTNLDGTTTIRSQPAPVDTLTRPNPLKAIPTPCLPTLDNHLKNRMTPTRPRIVIG